MNIFIKTLRKNFKTEIAGFLFFVACGLVGVIDPKPEVIKSADISSPRLNGARSVANVVGRTPHHSTPVVIDSD